MREQLQVCCLAGEIIGTICYILSTLTVVILSFPASLRLVLVEGGGREGGRRSQDKHVRLEVGGFQFEYF